MKKILMIGPFSPPITGNSLVNDKILELLQTQNCTIKTINTSFYDFKEKNGVFSFSKLFYYLGLHFKLYKIFYVKYIYISIGQTFFGVLKNGAAIITSRILRKKIVIHLHGNELGENYINSSKFQKKIFRLILSCANSAIVLSEGLKYNMEFFLKPQQIYTLNNFIDHEILGKKEEIKNKNFNSLKLLFLSNLMTEKGIFELLKALEDLQKENIFIPVEFYGNIDTINKDLILNKIKNLGNNVAYCGVANKFEKRKAFIRNNVFILPSYNEGMPLSILEAMGTGNMIIVSDLIGLKGVLKKNTNAFFIKSKSSNDIKEALKDIQINIKKYQHIGAANFLIAKEKYNEQKFITNLMKIFNDV